MLHKNKYIAISLFLISSLLSTYSIKGQIISDSIIFRSMNDEISRSMTDFKYKDYDKPCYISYELINAYSLLIHGEIGAIFSVDSSVSRGWSYRLIVGDYKINDENFSGQNQNTNYGNNGFGGMGNLFPVDDNYYGIRRAFWVSSNDIYLRAAANHKEKLKLIKDGKISTESLNYDDFSTTPQVNISKHRTNKSISLETLVSKVKSLSNLYFEYQGLSYSSANIEIKRNDLNYVSSEGSIITFPMDLAILSVSLMKKNDENEELYNSLSIMALTPEDFPSKEELKPEIKLLADNLEALVVAEELKYEYTGPVLFCGQITANILMENLFDYDRSLFAERNDLIVNESGEVFYDEIVNEWQSKVGRKILPTGLNLTAKPRLETWQGKHLFGSFLVDSEGVVPPDSIVLVVDGKLVGFLSSRTPTSVSNNSNGHKRYSYSYAGLGHYSGPSVTIVESTECKTISELKSELIKVAEDEGLDYAIIVRNLESEIADMPFNYYKVDLKSGEETLLGNIEFTSTIESSAMKKIRFSTEVIVTNTLFNSYISPSGSGSSNGLMTSYIGPKAMLVNDFRLNISTKKDLIHIEKDNITNPLERNK